MYLLEIIAQGVDGSVFLELTEGDLKEILPNRIGFVRKLIRLQKEVSAQAIILFNNSIDILTVAVFGKLGYIAGCSYVK